MQRTSSTSEAGSAEVDKKPSGEELRSIDAIVGEQVARAVIAGLRHFGTGAIVESLVYILELDHSVNLRSVAFNPNSLRDGLEKMFGGAAYVVEAKICQALGKELGVDSEGKTLEDLIELLKSRVADGSIEFGEKG